MSKIIPFHDKDLGIIYVEVVDIPDSSDYESTTPKTGTDKLSGGTTKKVIASLEDSLHSVGVLAGKITQAIVNNPLFPDEIECKVGIKFTADAGIMIAKVGAEGNLELTLKWNSKQIIDRSSSTK